MSAAIAIIGMAFKLPGGDDEATIADVLVRGSENGRSLLSRPPPDRWPFHRIPLPDAAPRFAETCGFIEGAFDFDPRVFSISPREARLLDPQHRMMLEMSLFAQEDAGYGGGMLADTRTGVFVGSTRTDYIDLILMHLAPEDYVAAVMNSRAVLANRVSSVFNFKGPSLTIDTLCSSSMVAVHEACRSLCAGDCDVALAGGVNFLMSPYYLFVLNRMQLLSRTGLSRPFDPQADGFVPSEGGAVFCLKRLPDALADGDPIRAVIAGSAIVHHGHSAGLTVPDAAAMAQAMRDALGAAAAEPASVDLVQAMGAGNRLSDGAELEALCNVFATSDRAEPIALSCEKGAIGHLESASGAAGLVALILELERHMRFPLHSGGAAPALGVAGLRAVHHPEDWIADRPRRAALDSFSMTGTLVHLIVEEAPVPARSDHSAGWLILPISADNEVDLATQAAAYAVAIARLSPDAIADACFTAATGRRHGRHRAAIVAAGRDALIKGLTAVTTRSVADGSGVTVIRGRIGAPLYGFPIRRARASRVDARRQVDRIACEQAAQGFAAGEPVAWDALQSGRRRRIRMPKTRLERQTYLFEPANDAPQRPAAPVARAALHPLLSGARRG